MKKYLSLFGFCLTLSQIVAQTTFNVAYQDKSETSGYAAPCFVKINSDYYYSTLRTDAENNFTSYLYRLSDNNGQLKFKIPNFISFLPFKLIRTLDNKLLFVGTEIFCDVIPPHPKNFICKVDTNGAVLFTNYYAEDQFLASKNVVQHSDSTYYAFADSIMYHYDKTGQLILRKNLGLRIILSSLLLGNGNILLSATSNNINALCQMNSLGVITSTIGAPTRFTKLEFYNGTEIMGLGMDNKIHKISNSLTFIGSSNFNSSISLKDFTVANDTVYCISYYTLESYFVSDTTFNTVYSSTTTAGGIKQEAIIKNQDLVGVLSSARSKSSADALGGHNYVTLNVFGKYASNNFVDDIELVSIQADSSYALITSVTPSTVTPPNTTYDIYMRAKVKVKNKSNLVLNNFKLNAYKFPDIACGSYYYQQKFDIAPLPPGDTVEVMTPFIQKTVWVSAAPSLSISAPFCIFGTVPNSRADKAYEDNELCTTLTYTVNDVSIKENSFVENQLIISPNPFNTSIHIKSEVEISTIEIQNCLGQKLKSSSINSHQTELNLSEFTSGIYFLKIETESGAQLKKVIKN